MDLNTNFSDWEDVLNLLALVYDVKIYLKMLQHFTTHFQYGFVQRIVKLTGRQTVFLGTPGSCEDLRVNIQTLFTKREINQDQTNHVF